MLRKTKYLVSLLLSLILIFSLVGCTTKVENMTSSESRGYFNPDSLVTAKELKEMKDVVIVDFTKNGGKYIPQAIRIERNSIATKINDIGGMLVDKKTFEKVLRNAGINNGDTVVIYDSDKELWASRLWWAMKVYGHKDVRLLDGGLDAWISQGYETKEKPLVKEASNYLAKEANKDLIADLEFIKKTYNDNKLIVLDTRSDKEWDDGHIKGAVHVEWSKALNEDGTLKTKDELLKIYKDAGITKDLEAVIPHCKSGVRGAHTLFVLKELLGFDNVKLYDGSWLEYSISGEPISK